MSEKNEALRKQRRELLEIDAALIEADEKILAYVGNDPRRQLALEEKFGLIKRRHFVKTGEEIQAGCLDDVDFKYHGRVAGTP